MDISAAAATTSSVKTPEFEPAPTQIQPSKPVPLTNGVLKRHNHLHHHHRLPAVVVTYKECLKNHAAAIGGHAVDGCGEFMPSPTASPADPTSLTCDACGCHRNFHRRDPEEPLPPSAQHVIEYQPHHRHRPPPPPSGRRSPNSASPPPISSTYYPSAPHMLLALSGGGVSGPPPENTNPAAVLSPNGRKRRRSKFTADQKQRMWEFAERIGWKMQRREEEAIADFCGGVGVEKRVFKVWMHNHKGILVKRDVNSNNDNGGSVGALAGAANGSSSSC